jgi:hypothetical protein
MIRCVCNSVSPAVAVVLVILSGAFCCGCGSSPQARYPGYPAKQKNISVSIIVADYVVVDDLLGDTNKIDLPENKKNAQRCLNFLAGALNARGYNVDRIFLSSIGLLMDPAHVYRLAASPADEVLADDLLSTALPPFYLDPRCGKDSLVQKLFAALYRGLINLEEGNSEGRTRLPVASYLGKSLGGGTMVVMLVGGYNIPVTNQIGAYTAPKRIVDDKISMKSVSQLSVRLYVIDSATGEVLWDDHSFRQGGVIYPEKIFDAIEDLTKRLP